MKKGLNKSIEKHILRDLWDKRDGIFVFKIPSTYGITVSEVFPFINQYVNWIEYKNGKIKLYDYARVAVRAAINKNSSYIGNDNMRNHIPILFEGPSVSVDDLVLPKDFMCKNR